MLSVYVAGFFAPRNYSPNSLRQRRWVIGAFIASVGDIAPADLTPAIVMDWWAGIGHQAVQSRQSQLSAVRSFMSYLQLIGILVADPTLAIQRPRCYPAPPVTLSIDQVMHVIVSAGTVRNRAILALMLGCGLRACDLASVDVQNIDLANAVVTVRGKGNKVRLVPMPTVAVECVTDLLRLEKLETGPLVRNCHGQRFSVQGIRLLITRYMYRIGVKECPHDGRSSHVLRRTCATMLLESGTSIREVATVLGHESISTTQRYLALPDTKKLVAVVEHGPLAAFQPAG